MSLIIKGEVLIMGENSMASLLTLKGVNISFKTDDGDVRAACDINITLEKGEIFGLIGETGCGKSVIAHAILRLLPENAQVLGEIIYKGENLCFLSAQAIRKIRGKEIGLIAQNPSEALNPLLKNGYQVTEAICRHRNLSHQEGWRVAEDILRELDIPKPESRMAEYPHQLSGGMKQRILTAIGIGGTPALLIADEPTKGLDALIRGQVVDVLSKLASDTGTTILLITHDLQVAAKLCDQVAVMYAGEIIEQGKTSKLFTKPRHPYLRGLIASLPENGLNSLNGFSPSLINLPSGCKFHDRCDQSVQSCAGISPVFKQIDEDHKVRCHSID